MLRDLPRSARVLVLTGPLFAPAALAAPFAVAYQAELGLAPAHIALLAAAAAALGFAFLGLGALAAERWGRLRAFTAFDVAGFVGAGLLLAAARSPAEAAAAVLLAATAAGAQAGFQALLMAEVPAGRRQRVLALEHLLLVVPSAAMPLVAAAMVAAWGLVPAMRGAYLLYAAGAAAMVALRWALLRREPAAAARGAAEPGWAGLGASVRGLAAAGALPVLAASGVVAFAGSTGVLAQLYVLDVARIDAVWLGPFATAMTSADVLASAAASRLPVGARAWVVAGAGLAAAGVLVFLAAGGPALLLASGALLGLAGPWLGLGTGALLHDAVPDALRERAAAAQAAARVAGAVAGAAAGGWLFTLDPRGPWLVAAPAFLLGAAVLAATGARGSRAASAGPSP